MNWWISLLFVEILTTITGAVFTLVWFALGLLLERAGYLNIVFALLNGVALFWMFPMAFVFLFVLDKRLKYRLDSTTPSLGVVGMVLCIVWLGGCVCWLCAYIRQRILCSRFRKSAFPCKKKVQALFEETCESLGIRKGRCEIVQSYGVRVPCVSGILHPKVYLPVEEYSEEQLRIFLLHEMLHYQQKDLWLKQITSLLYIVHWFNPVMWAFSKWVGLWSEYSVDYKACRRLGDLKSYVAGLFSIAFEDDRVPMVASHLVEKRSDIGKRVRKMIKNYKRQQKSKAVVAALVAGMIMSGTGTVYAAASGISNGYLEVYDQTDEQNMENIGLVKDDLVEFIDMTDDSDYIIVEEDGDQDRFTGAEVLNRDFSQSYNWTIDYEVIYTSSRFSASSGGTIQVSSVMTPNNLDCYVGIIQPNLVKRCVYGHGSILHDFSVTQNGKHRFYIRNNNFMSVSAHGAYSYFAP